MEAIIDPEKNLKIDNKLLFILIPSFGDNPLLAVQSCELAKDIWDIPQERYEGKTVINKFSLLSNILKMRYWSEQSMAEHVSVLESHLTQLASMETEFDDFTKFAIIISNLEDQSEFEALITLVVMMKGGVQTWSQVISLFIGD